MIVIKHNVYAIEKQHCAMNNDADNASKPKHVIRDSKAFQKGREALGEIILNGMQATGGTDIDWLIEHRGRFMIFENKEFHNDIITIPVGQMIAFERLHKALNTSTKCHFIFGGSEENTDFKNPNSPLWYFEMVQWNDGTIPHTKNMYGKWYLVDKKYMLQTSVGDYRKMIEVFWKNFETK